MRLYIRSFTMVIIFWFLFFIVFFTYIGYGLMVYVLVKLRGKRVNYKKTDDPHKLPAVVHLVPAYNEDEYIGDKIDNSLSLDYPKDKYGVWIVTDGSTDDTAGIVQSINGVRHFHLDERKGKIHAVKRVVREIDSEIIVFSDANTELNKEAIMRMVQHFNDPQVGVVAGEKKVRVEQSDQASSVGEGFYWKYESFLKRYDYYLYTTVGAAGELFAIRTELFEDVPDDSIIEDFYLSLKIASKGFRIAYEPDAYALENSSDSVKEESKRKIRIAAGGLQSIWRLRKLFNIFKYGWLSFQFIFHRAIRWTLAPLALPFLFVINLVLALGGSEFYQILFALQLVFYSLALVGWMLQSRKLKLKVFFIPFYFVFMNWAVFLGFGRIIFGKQSVVWERAGRKKSHE